MVGDGGIVMIGVLLDAEFDADVDVGDCYLFDVGVDKFVFWDCWDGDAEGLSVADGIDGLGIGFVADIVDIGLEFTYIAGDVGSV